LTRDHSTGINDKTEKFFSNRTSKISSSNELTLFMDYGESEAVILYKELNADFLLIDDKKARRIAENFEINCIGTLGILSVAKDKKFLNELRSYFKLLLEHNRYYSLDLLNYLLDKQGERKL
jgi:predicted nucleic acid-binding protein